VLLGDPCITGLGYAEHNCERIRARLWELAISAWWTHALRTAIVRVV
jgi:hypothetical protein